MLLVVALDIPADVQAAGGRSVDIGRKEVVVAGGVETGVRHLGAWSAKSCCHAEVSVVARANLQLNDYDEEMSWGMPLWLVIGCQRFMARKC